MMKDDRLKLNNNKQLRNSSGEKLWISAYVKPSGRYWKRKAAKKVRRYGEISSGSSYKKFFGWMDWC